MHAYYAKNKGKLKRELDRMLSRIAPELEAAGGKTYRALFDEIWAYYEAELLEHLPYIGGNKVSGTRNLTGAYGFVAMGEVLKRYGGTTEESGRLMALAFERMMRSIPRFVRKIAAKLARRPGLLNKVFLKKDAKNRANVAQNPGSFASRTQIPPEEGFDFSFHILACPLADFARRHGYEEYMPYLCNLDYVTFGALGLPLFRTHTRFEDGDYCDFKVKYGAERMEAWPPVYTQGKGYK